MENIQSKILEVLDGLLHDTPSSVISGILHAEDIILTVTLSMINTYR